MTPLNATPAPASPDPDPSTLPVRVDRRTAAEIVTRHFFPVSHRTIEAWPLAVRRVNGRALFETRELIEHARAVLDAAPPIRGGRTHKPVPVRGGREAA